MKIDWMLGAKVAWATFVALSLAAPLRDANERWFARCYFRQVRPGMLGAAFVVVALTVAVGLTIAQVPGLDWTWFRLIPGQERSEGGNLWMMPIHIPILGFAFLALIAINTPAMADAEERLFRLGTRGWLDAIPRSLLFGLTHCVVGVPLAYGFALTLPGLWFSYHYRQGGVWRSTLHHVAYNLVVLSLAGALLLIGALA